jgi:phosphoribosyl-AMP cyclohydrolase
MADDTPSPFASRGSPQDVETGLGLTPRFDAAGLLPAVATDAQSGEVLMLAWMNAEALARTIETGEAHFFSRSRARLWRKGEKSGNVMSVVELRTDCDQDAVWLRVRMGGAGLACHTGAPSCFYRRVPMGQPPGADTKLEQVGNSPMS